MKSFNRRQRGQGLVEFALVMPIMLLIMMGIFDFGRVFVSYAMASNALRGALRNAEVFGYNDTTINYTDCASMRSTIKKVFFAGKPTITIQYQKASTGTIIPCSGASIDASLLANGDLLEINVTNTVKLITPFISQIVPVLQFNFYGQRTIVNNIPLTTRASGDVDYDGLLDTWEIKNFCPSLIGVPSTDPRVSACLASQTGTDDPDHDGCDNGCEQTNGTNPNVADTDGDGLNDGAEIYTYKTNPLKADTDGDGLTDGQEVNIYHTDPLNPDTDGDGVSDGAEVAAGGDPLHVPSLSINDVMVNEPPNGTTTLATFTVTLLHPTGVQTTTVNYATVPGTATSTAGPGNYDFTMTSGTLTFPPGVSGAAIQQTVSVTINGDNILGAGRILHGVVEQSQPDNGDSDSRRRDRRDSGQLTPENAVVEASFKPASTAYASGGRRRNSSDGIAVPSDSAARIRPVVTKLTPASTRICIPVSLVAVETRIKPNIALKA